MITRDGKVYVPRNLIDYEIEIRPISEDPAPWELDIAENVRAHANDSWWCISNLRYAGGVLYAGSNPPVAIEVVAAGENPMWTALEAANSARDTLIGWAEVDERKRLPAAR